MKTIVITAEQMEVIQEYLDGKIGMFTATDHQMEVMSGVIETATTLLDELDAYDELDENNDNTNHELVTRLINVLNNVDEAIEVLYKDVV